MTYPPPKVPCIVGKVLPMLGQPGTWPDNVLEVLKPCC